MKLPPAPKKANPLDKISPVTDAMLQNPPAGRMAYLAAFLRLSGLQSAQADHEGEREQPARCLELAAIARRE